MNFTTDQQHAITHTGHDVLVSASAGSGKTAVLVERIVSQVLAGQDVTRMLIVTFTNAATAEMKLKIQKALKDRLTEARHTLSEAQRRHLANQIAVMNAAPIMTLDAFSLQVVQHYYYIIDLEPGFRLLTDDTERTLLETRVWESLRETEYAGANAAAFAALADNFSGLASGNPTQDGLQPVVFQLLQYAQTTTAPAQWLQALPDAYSPAGLDALFAHQLWPQLRPQLLQLAAGLEAARATLADPALAPWEANLQTTLDQVTNALALDAPDYAAAQAALSAIGFDRWPGKKVDDSLKPAKDAAHAQREALKPTLAAVQASVAIAPADLTAALTQVGPLMTTLSRVCQDFLAALTAEKAARHVQGFADIAQNALRILTAVDPQTHQTVAANYQAAFDTVLVDEYQDINQLQEALLTAVSQSTPGNRFMVGDVKQSIYGFRLADPQLFLAKYQAFGADSAAGERIVLAENFRSSSNILAFTNLVFSQLMDTQVGQLDYDEDAQLKLGATDIPEEFAPATEFLIHLTDQPEDDAPAGDDETAAGLDKDQAEAQMVIRRIQAMVQDPDCQLYDRKAKAYRRVTYRDITLLSRSRSQNIVLQSEFARAGVPIVIADAQNYFKTTELMVMLSLLRVIDNPKQEIALVAVLRSPLVGLSADALALIRLADRFASFDDALVAFATQSGGTAFAQQTRQQVQAFLTQLAEFRDFAREHELVDLIWHLYAETGYLDFVAGLPGGAQRQANLRALASRAAGYENGGFKGLFAFIRFIELMQKQNKDLAMPVTLAPDVNAVSLMTIHGSKGLQFPVVFLMAASKQLNLKDLNQPLILTPELVGCQWLDPATREVYALPQYQAAKAAKKAQLLAEEERLLYVALTRAEQRLVIVGTGGTEEQLRAKWAKVADAPDLLLPAGVRAGAGSTLDWLGAAIARTEAVTEGTPLPALRRFNAPITLTFVHQVVPVIQATKATSGTQPATSLDLPAWLAFTYPYAAATATTGFQSVSEIKRAFDDPDTIELVTSNRQLGGNRYVNDFAQPAFLATGTQVPRTVVGSATHLVLQLLDLGQPVTVATIEATVAELVAAGTLTEAVAQQIDVATLVRFFATPLGQALQANAATVQREVAFSLLLPAAQLFAPMQGDDADVLIHGIIDGFFETAAGVTLFDYKTDHVVGASAPIVERYRGQLNLYARALAHLTAKPVLHRYLVLLATGEVIDLAPTAKA
ncbi:helicase-exonuclease AddAB subunit AddA [Lacticaseibacillus daqingensis]|uniref:helicase-exonuclease AddAB subunit AddA n=1 Tax=Lacticaseibacillus daqingensis TaxID=2486014 RepID=UPI000F792F02|nr:helicase-exonuclease AddAB subunit AddA [Lacticaseibacillus daqingensis]